MKQLLKKLKYKFFLDKAYGLYISTNRIMLFSPYEDFDSVSWQSEKTNDKEVLIEKAIQEAIRKIRKGLKRWPRIELLICFEGNKHSFSKTQLEHIGRTYNVSWVWTVNPESCLAIGSDEEITDNQKRLYVAINKKTIDGFLFFAAGVYSKFSCLI